MVIWLGRLALVQMALGTERYQCRTWNLWEFWVDPFVSHPQLIESWVAWVKVWTGLSIPASSRKEALAPPSASLQESSQLSVELKGLTRPLGLATSRFPPPSLVVQLQQFWVLFSLGLGPLPWSYVLTEQIPLEAHQHHPLKLCYWVTLDPLNPLPVGRGRGDLPKQG
jgi:hypothetical protein